MNKDDTDIIIWHAAIGISLTIPMIHKNRKQTISRRKENEPRHMFRTKRGFHTDELRSRNDSRTGIISKESLRQVPVPE